MDHRTPRNEGVFHYITLSVTIMVSIAYFNIASDLGGAPVKTEFRDQNEIHRQVFLCSIFRYPVSIDLR
jgi:bacteriorhodopsin